MFAVNSPESHFGAATMSAPCRLVSSLLLSQSVYRCQGRGEVLPRLVACLVAAIAWCCGMREHSGSVTHANDTNVNHTNV